MVHGGSRSFRFDGRDADPDDSFGEPLEWATAGPWTYALGDFGSIRGLGMLSPWVVRVGGHPGGTYRTLDAARRALETAALAAGGQIAR